MTNKANKHRSIGIIISGVLVLMLILFLVLKLTGLAEFDWDIVIMPFVVQILMCLFLLLIFAIARSIRTIQEDEDTNMLYDSRKE